MITRNYNFYFAYRLVILFSRATVVKEKVEFWGNILSETLQYLAPTTSTTDDSTTDDSTTPVNTTDSNDPGGASGIVAVVETVMLSVFIGVMYNVQCFFYY